MQFRQVYDDNVGFVWRSLRRLGVREASLKDAVQEVFLVVHRRLDAFEERARLRTWLFRICMHTAKDQRRRAHVRHEVFDVELQSVAAQSKGAAELVEQREDLALFDAALEKLSLEQRAVFILFELEEMTGEKIAECLELPLGTVYSRLRLARQSFRRAVLVESKQRGVATRAGGEP
ncbi:MAG TPA: sigma-70 family RNA polymerase sigma factor [Polyangiaceae bacterium]|jgi:RNA polymerase sigma-70 factor (ECF subfamily)|nr:sigma-70 family RNA polymerase sigma factor [Polyangiaceae bacterium]